MSAKGIKHMSKTADICENGYNLQPQRHEKNRNGSFMRALPHTAVLHRDEHFLPSSSAPSKPPTCPSIIPPVIYGDPFLCQVGHSHPVRWLTSPRLFRR